MVSNRGNHTLHLTKNNYYPSAAAGRLVQSTHPTCIGILQGWCAFEPDLKRLKRFILLLCCHMSDLLDTMASLLSILYALFISTAVTALPYTESVGDKLGAVASESSVCSTIGIDLLRIGGNAADAV